MTGRENSEEQFEREWREAFDEWSEEPPKTVWTGIDRQLAYEDLGAYKAKLAVYRWVAAAVVLMAVSFGAISYFSQQSENYVITAAADINAPNPELPFDWALDNWFERSTSQVDGFSSVGSGVQDIASISGLAGEEESNGLMPLYEIQPLTSKPLEVQFSNSYQDKHLYYLPVYNFHKKKKSAESSQYWAGLDVGSGSFNPNYSSSANSLASNLGVNAASGFSQNSNRAFDSQSPTVRENMTAGETVSMGVNFGLKLGERWTLESGVQYARADAMTETNVIVRSDNFQEVIPATVQSKNIPAVVTELSKKAVVEYDYRDVNMNNVFEFTSIPVKAGYVLLDEKFSMELNAGVVANIYLGNRLSTSDPNVAELTIGPGDSSPYRDLSFSGLAGVQLGYRFMKNFDFVLEPNYRQSINSITKSNSSFVANPSGFALTTGLRYNFN